MVNQYLDSALCIAVIGIMGICAITALYMIANYYIPEETGISEKVIKVKSITKINGEFLIDSYDGFSYVSKEAFSMSIFEVNKTYKTEVGNYYGELHKQREHGVYGLIIGVVEV